MIALVLGLAHAATVDVPCDTAALIGAMRDANATAEPDTLLLSPECVYLLVDVAPDADLGFWMGGVGLPLVTSDLTIEGRGATLRRIPDAPPFRIVAVAGSVRVTETPAYPAAGRLVLRDLTLKGGLARGGAGGFGGGGGGAGLGGCVVAQGDTLLERVTLTGCGAQGGAGGQSGSGLYSAGGGGLGGGGGTQRGGGGGFLGRGGDGRGYYTTDTSANGGGGGAHGDAFNEWPGGTTGDAHVNGPGACSLAAPWSPGATFITDGGPGGGGGGQTAPPTHLLTGRGGHGGFGAGGAAGIPGGDGGFGGGGGASSNLGEQAGHGGFGGGGGSGYTGGNGGFGGGAGGGRYGGGGAPGFGGGAPGGGDTVNQGPGGGGAGLGGAVFAQGATLTLVRSTVTGNAATGGTSDGTPGQGLGAAVFALDADVVLDHVTFAEDTGDGFVGHGTATLTAENTLFAGTGAACDLYDGAVFTSGGHNALTDPGGCTFDDPTDLVDPVDPISVLALGDHGGPTPTMVAEPPSAHLGAGTCDAGTDQRGFPVAAGPCDIGATELLSFTLTVEVIGAGFVTVDGAPCDTGCTRTVVAPGPVDLAATADASPFVGWFGACGAFPSCTYEVGANTTVIARFDAPPTAAADSYTTPEDTPLDVAAPGVLANDADPDGQALVAEVVTGPAHGVLDLVGGGFVFTPEADWSGIDGFTYRAFDGVGYTDPATVTLTVAMVDDPPRVPDVTFSSNARPVSVAAPGLLEAVVDVDSAMLTARLVSGDAVVATDGGFTLDAPAGVHTFEYAVSDGVSEVIATATVVIRGANLPPVAVDDAYTGAGVVLADVADGLLANDADPDGDALDVTVADAPAHGTVTLTPTGAFAYVPYDDTVLDDAFTYTVSDGVDTATATVTVTLTPPDEGCGCDHGAPARGLVLAPLLLALRRRRS